MSLFTGSFHEVGDARAVDVVILDANGTPITSFGGGTSTPPSGATLSTVAASNASVTLLAANPARKSFVIYNQTNKTLLVAYANAASANAYTFPVGRDSAYESRLNDYTGIITGKWDSAGASGQARITEIT